MYQWRTLSASQRAETLSSRIQSDVPWHGPPRFDQHAGNLWYHLTAACYEHRSWIGASEARISRFECELLVTCEQSDAIAAAWCILPNHYHVLVCSDDLTSTVRAFGKLHGRSSHLWNIEEECVGRKVFHRTSDRLVRSEAHFWATLNYIHHNPVKHGHAVKWTDWRWSSANRYLAEFGVAEATRIWRMYPVLDYGAGWDD